MSVKVRERPKGSSIWWLYISHRGQRKTKKIGSLKAAKEVALKIEARLAIDDFKLAPAVDAIPTMCQYASRWMAGHVRTNLKPSTYAGYKYLLANHIFPTFGNRRLPDIARNEVKELCYAKIREGLSPRTVQYIARTLSAIYNSAVEDGIVSVNPATRPGRYIRTGDRIAKIDFLVPEEGRVFLEASRVKAPRHYPLHLLALRTGMRQGEIIALQWGDVDWNGKFIEIRRASWKGHMLTPKSGKSRRVDMSDQLAAVLLEHRIMLGTESLAKGRPMPEWVFPSEAGTMLDSSNLRKIFDACLKVAGLRKIRFHDLRHSFASWLIANAESLAYVKDQLGHHSIQITVDTYGHLVPGANRQAVNRLDDPDWMTDPAAPPPPPPKKKTSGDVGQIPPRPMLALVVPQSLSK